MKLRVQMDDEGPNLAVLIPVREIMGSLKGLLGSGACSTGSMIEGMISQLAMGLMGGFGQSQPPPQQEGSGSRKRKSRSQVDEEEDDDDDIIDVTPKRRRRR